MLINEENQRIIKERFAPMQGEVVIQYFESSLDCPTCGEIKQLLEEVVSLSDLLSLEVNNFHIDENKVKEFGIDRIPAFHLTDASRKNYGIQFYGAPSGYEFATLLEDILMVSQGESGLQDGTKQSLATLSQPVNLNVFVTPTCPYCPRAVRLAHQFAFESGLVQGAMVEATEFPDWSNEFSVYGVPKTVINNSEAFSVEGAVPEPMLLEKVLEAVR